MKINITFFFFSSLQAKGSVALAPPNFNHLLLTQMLASSENFNKIHPQVFVSLSELTMLNFENKISDNGNALSDKPTYTYINFTSENMKIIYMISKWPYLDKIEQLRSPPSQIAYTPGMTDHLSHNASYVITISIFTIRWPSHWWRWH